MIYNVFIPIVSTPKKKKGITMSKEYENFDDIVNLNCSWYYNWGYTTNLPSSSRIEFIPMSWSGNLVGTVSKDLLVFNEPDNHTQANLTPKEAALKYRTLLEYYGLDKLIVGGWMFWGGYTWAHSFLNEVDNLYLPRPKRYHMHGYVEWNIEATQIINFWKDCMNLTGGTYTITEYGDVDGYLNNIKTLTEFLEKESRVERYSIFCNRVTGKEPWYPESWPQPALMGLIDNDTNKLTKLGEYYVKV